MIDLHTHLLPGVDDGSHTVEQSVEVLERFVTQGVKSVCCTPHLRASEAGSPPCDALDDLLAELRDAAPPAITLARGFEVLLDIPEPDLADRCLGIAGTRYVLVEYHRRVTAEVSVAVLRHVARQGRVPLLAHPERYAVCSPELAVAWHEAGAVLQVEATALLGDSPRAARARALVQGGHAAILASDNHGDRRTVYAAKEWLEGHGGGRQVDLLTVENPAAILADAAVAPVPPTRFRRSLFTRFRDLVVGEEGT
jgi:protein-tyrosine phosphatase